MGVIGMGMAMGLTSTADLDGVVEAFQTAANAAIPEIATGALSQVAQGAANALGLAGNVDANALQALTQGRVFNPYSEQLFSNMNFRTTISLSKCLLVVKENRKKLIISSNI